MEATAREVVAPHVFRWSSNSGWQVVHTLWPFETDRYKISCHNQNMLDRSSGTCNKTSIKFNPAVLKKNKGVEAIPTSWNNHSSYVSNWKFTLHGLCRRDERGHPYIRMRNMKSDQKVAVHFDHCAIPMSIVVIFDNRLLLAMINAIKSLLLIQNNQCLPKPGLFLTYSLIYRRWIFGAGAILRFHD